VEGDEPEQVHQAFAATLDQCYVAIRAIQAEARAHGVAGRPRWPAIVLRTPKGWTGPKELAGLPIEGTFRAHQVPLPDVRANPEQLRLLEAWLRSYHPEKLFDVPGTLIPELAALAPTGERRLGANPHANGGKVCVPLDLPDFRAYAVELARPGVERRESPRQLGQFLRDTFTRNRAPANFRVFSPDELTSNRLNSVLEVESRGFVGRTIDLDDHLEKKLTIRELPSLTRFRKSEFR
jgi:xylulose-5-phosphate/fructose-6-phosphate phosphoketolase